MHLSHLADQFQQLRTACADAAMMNLQDVVHQQVERPRSEGDASAFMRPGVQLLQAADHLVGICLQTVTGRGQIVLTVAAEIQTELFEHSCCIEIACHQSSDGRTQQIFFICHFRFSLLNS